MHEEGYVNMQAQSNPSSILQKCTPTHVTSTIQSNPMEKEPSSIAHTNNKATQSGSANVNRKSPSPHHSP